MSPSSHRCPVFGYVGALRSWRVCFKHLVVSVFLYLHVLPVWRLHSRCSGDPPAALLPLHGKQPDSHMFERCPADVPRCTGLWPNSGRSPIVPSDYWPVWVRGIASTVFITFSAKMSLHLLDATLYRTARSIKSEPRKTGRNPSGTRTAFVDVAELLSCGLEPWR